MAQHDINTYKTYMCTDNLEQYTLNWLLGVTNYQA